jgi:site-specific DNA-methyltransferase (adenine-specific)
MTTSKKWGDMNSNYKIHHGDNRKVLKNLADNSIDSVVTDPPYELGFMGKSWDATGVAYSVELWQEVMRVLKPGGHLLAFSGSRTYHRMAVAIEDAGFEIRDQIMWIYGSGFPKSHDVSKGIDKQAGAEREVVGETIKGAQTESTGRYGAWGDGITPTAPATAEAKQWQGWGTALKPAHEPIVVARKPLIGTVAANVLTYGTGGLNIDGTRVGYQEGEVDFTKQQNQTATATVKMGGAKPGDSIQMFKENGRWPANVIHDGSDEVVELFPQAGNKWKRNYGVEDYEGKQYAGGSFGGGGYNGANTYADSGSAARFFYCAKASKRDRNEGLDGFEAQRDHDGRQEGGVGGSNPRNRTNTAKVNHHPTVKPTELMRYLCRLVTPPGGIVLDPFMGSGSTGKAAMYEGFEFVGIELTDEYLPIAKARIEFAIEEMKARLL